MQAGVRLLRYQQEVDEHLKCERCEKYYYRLKIFRQNQGSVKALKTRAQNKYKPKVK